MKGWIIGFHKILSLYCLGGLVLAATKSWRIGALRAPISRLKFVGFDHLILGNDILTMRHQGFLRVVSTFGALAMRFVLVLSLVILPIFNGVFLSGSHSDKTEQTSLDAKNPGCDPDVHVCSDYISG